MGFTPTDTIWFNGQLTSWPDARVHVLAHGLQYGTGVFEGLRSYGTADGPAVFRLDSHLDRLYRSAAIYDLEIPYTIEALTEATLNVIRVNRLEASYIRPVVFVDAGTLSVWTKDSPVSVAIAAFPTGTYLAGAENGVRVTVSPIRKYPSNAIPASAKACGQYINSARAVTEAQKRGFDEAILLNQRGDVSEGSGENIFVVKNGGLLTNGVDADILMGVTRDSILQIAADLKIPARVGTITMDDLLTADELFFSGTAVEVTSIREVDGTVIGSGTPGAVTARLQQVFNDAVRGKRPEYRKWLAFAGQTVAK
ncbi:MAG TPA: branched-chain amino acid transaminase [Vicinamibacterales bacterium]|jgi:branched-chain amino acid aminotransferase|nr:branched-chain amino acid transaminase [Vicinamibacterales bacterium]